MGLEELLGIDKSIFNVLHIKKQNKIEHQCSEGEDKIHSVLVCVVRNSPRLKYC